LILVNKLLDKVKALCNQVMDSLLGGLVHANQLELIMKFSKVGAVAAVAVAVTGIAQAQVDRNDARRVVIEGTVEQECVIPRIGKIDLDLDVVDRSNRNGLMLRRESEETTSRWVGCNYPVKMQFRSRNGALTADPGFSFNPRQFTDEIDYRMRVELGRNGRIDTFRFNSTRYGAGERVTRNRSVGPFWARRMSVNVSTIRGDKRPVAGTYRDVNRITFVSAL
jgi:hypothetical protein